MFCDSLYVGSITDTSRVVTMFATILQKIDTDNTLLFHLIDAKLNVILFLSQFKVTNISNLGIFPVFINFLILLDYIDRGNYLFKEASDFCEIIIGKKRISVDINKNCFSFSL